MTATVEDESGNPVPDVTVAFDVTGSNSESGSEITNDDGEVEFCYTGELLAGVQTLQGSNIQVQRMQTAG